MRRNRSAATIVAPNGYETTEGNNGNGFPFNNFTGRYQQAYAASEFVARLRPGGAPAVRYADVERELEAGMSRVFDGEYEVVELPTLEVGHPDGTGRAVNDVVVASAELGRMIELDLAVGGEELGRQPCDGIICSTPSGSTAYNLSNGGPVLMWGLEAMAVTYVAAHSLHARPLVTPPGADVIVWNRTHDVEAGVLVDGHRVSTLGKSERAVIRIGAERSLLATLPEATFVRRYRQSFAS